jgi:tocopherol O-methyltransferase
MIESQLHETPETIASHYDDLDEFYREIWGLHVHHGLWQTGKESKKEATLGLIDYLLRDVDKMNLKSICDIGCGYGETARYLSNKYNARVTGLSVSDKQIEFAKKSGHNVRINLIKGDWMMNNLPDESFDLALSIESSEHMPDLKKFFSEAYRVLRPGGSLKVCAWLSKSRPKNWEYNYLLKPICTEGRLHLGDVSEYQNLIRETGFKSEKFEDVTDRVKKTWTLCLGGCAQKFLTDPKYLKFMLKSPSQNKNFLVSLLRIRLAYETKSMNYGIFTAVK